MRIAIDCRGLSKSPTGIPSYIISAVNALAKYKPDYELFLLAHQEFSSESKKLINKNQNIHILIKPCFLFPTVGFIWYFFKIPFLIFAVKADLFWAPSTLLPPVLPKNLLTLITIHDVVYKQFRNTMSWPDRVLSKILYDRSINKANYIWTVSEYTKREIETYFPKLESKKIYAGSSINSNLFKKVAVLPDVEREFRIKNNITGKIILFVGTLEPRKNLNFLLSLMPDLASKGFFLVLVGPKGWGNSSFYDELKKIKEFPSGNVIFAGFISSEMLLQLYNIADLFVSTSLNEGFGLPQLEAMACGCPVISPHNSAMVEVVEGAGETIKGWDKSLWIDKIEEVSKNRQKYIQSGLKRNEEYNWEKIIKGLVSFLEKK